MAAPELLSRNVNKIATPSRQHHIHHHPRGDKLEVMRSAHCACGGSCSACKAKRSQANVSQPSDPAEIEAERVADKIMRVPSPEKISMAANSNPEKIIHRKCDNCTDEEEKIQRKPLASSVDASISSPTPVKHALGSGGQPLDQGTRNFFEPHFNRDLGDVRIHTGNAAEKSAHNLNAKAYTVGNHIAFGAGQFAPQSQSGRRLLAHELTHVIQQHGGGEVTAGQNISRMENIAGVKEPAIFRACGSAEIGAPAGCIPSADEVSGLRYLFQVNCDDFAPGNEDDLRMTAMQIQEGDTVDIHGLASSDGDEVYNLNLSCARALRARAVIESVLSARGVSATIQVFNHGATEGEVTQQRSVVVSIARGTPAEPENRCGPDATDWFINQVNAAKTDPIVLAIKARLEGAHRLATRYGFSAERIAEGAVAKKVLAEEQRAGSPTRTTEASSQLTASVPGQRQFGRATLAATVPLVGAPEAFVLAAIKGAASAWKDLVGTGRRYDFKNDSRTMRNPTSANCPVGCANTITLCPSTSSDCYVVDVPGNIFYAHVGRFIGWTELTLQLGSQFAQLDASSTWDPPEDTRMISFAFALPDPLTRSDLCSQVNANRSVFDLQTCANCSEPTTAQIV